MSKNKFMENLVLLSITEYFSLVAFTLEPDAWTFLYTNDVMTKDNFLRYAKRVRRRGGYEMNRGSRVMKQLSLDSLEYNYPAIKNE